MPRSTTSGATEQRLRRHAAVGSSRKRLIAAAVVCLLLIVELVTAAALLGRPGKPAHVTHTMRLLDRGGPAGLAQRLTGEFDGAVEAVSSFWGDDWPREVVVVITGSDTDFAVQTGEPARDWHGVAAVAVADRVDLDRREAFGQRIVFAPGANSMSNSSLRIVLRHELFHFATRAETAFDAPRWLVEGVADYVARPAAPRPSAVAARLPTDAELDTEDGSRAYDRAWWFARFVADEYGRDGLRRLYIDACSPGHPDPAVAVQSALGVPLADLLTRWAHS